MSMNLSALHLIDRPTGDYILVRGGGGGGGAFDYTTEANPESLLYIQFYL